MDDFGNSEQQLNFRNAPNLDQDSRIFSRVGPQQGSRPLAPPIPPRVYGGGNNSNSYGYNSNYGMNSMFGNTGMGGYGSGYGSGFGSYGGFGGQMFGRSPMYGSGYGMGGYQMGGGDVPDRFIAIAEENSRSAFQSIESVVNTVLNIAAMLESTYFALTSSFRAVLGVAANFGRLKGLFSQIWSSFALLRGINWLIKKMLYALKITKYDPGSKALAEAFAAAETGQVSQEKKGSTMAVLGFLAFIMGAPYLLMKLIGSVSNSVLEETRNPKTWVNPVNAVAQYDFVASNQYEMSLRTGQNVIVAPKEIQATHKLLDSGWVLATIDGEKSSLVPVNHIESVSQLKQAKAKDIAEPVEHAETDTVTP